MTDELVEQVDALLPQTQCGECDYAACRPYAEAIVHHGEALDRCPPGGIETLRALGQLLKQDVTPYETDVAAKTRPFTLAKIQEDLCIGCTKCIQACPVDAIVGAPKLMHTVIEQDCTGCRLCIEPCPMDCIDLIPVTLSVTEKQQRANAARVHYQQREKRLKQQQQSAKQHFERAKQVKTSLQQNTTDARQAYIAAALARSKAKRHQLDKESKDNHESAKTS